MSTLELQQIKEQLLVLEWKTLKIFVSELLEAKKNKQKKSQQKTLPPHIREGIKESLEEYERGEYTTLSTDQEIDEYLENLLA